MSPNICLIKFDLLLLIGPPGSLSTVSYWMVTWFCQAQFLALAYSLTSLMWSLCFLETVASNCKIATWSHQLM